MKTTTATKTDTTTTVTETTVHAHGYTYRTTIDIVEFSFGEVAVHILEGKTGGGWVEFTRRRATEKETAAAKAIAAA